MATRKARPKTVRLSDLVRAAEEAGVDDPEVEIYGEDGEYWETFRPEAPVFRKGKMFLAGDSNARTACWEDGKAANPFEPENRR